MESGPKYHNRDLPDHLHKDLQDLHLNLLLQESIHKPPLNLPWEHLISSHLDPKDSPTQDLSLPS